MKELRCIPVSQDVLDRINAIPIYAPSPIKEKGLALEEALVLNMELSKSVEQEEYGEVLIKEIFGRL